MRTLLYLSALALAASMPVARAQLPDRTDPAKYSCAEFIGAGAAPARERAERMLYWVTGYVSGRLADAPAPQRQFGDISGKVAAMLFDRCPGHPGKSMADMADEMAREFSKLLLSRGVRPDDAMAKKDARTRR